MTIPAGSLWTINANSLLSTVPRYRSVVFSFLRPSLLPIYLQCKIGPRIDANRFSLYLYGKRPRIDPKPFVYVHEGIRALNLGHFRPSGHQSGILSRPCRPEPIRDRGESTHTQVAMRKTTTGAPTLAQVAPPKVTAGTMLRSPAQVATAKITAGTAPAPVLTTKITAASPIIDNPLPIPTMQIKQSVV